MIIFKKKIKVSKTNFVSKNNIIFVKIIIGKTQNFILFFKYTHGTNYIIILVKLLWKTVKNNFKNCLQPKPRFCIAFKSIKSQGRAYESKSLKCSFDGSMI